MRDDVKTKKEFRDPKGCFNRIIRMFPILERSLETTFQK
jgi:hypothetical protein